MQVKVTQELRAVPAGAVYPETFRVGSIVDGRIAEIALELKRGELLGAEETTENDESPPPSKTADAPAQSAGAVAPPPDPASAKVEVTLSKEDVKPKTVVVRARLKDRYEGPDDTGKTIKLAKGAVVASGLAQMLVDQGLATVLETKPA